MTNSYSLWKTRNDQSNPAVCWRCAAFDLGVSHLFTTKNVVAGFGDISIDNKRTITFEWICKAAALILISATVFAVTLIDYTSATSQAVCWISIAVLNVLSVISLSTAFKVNFLPYKLCPAFFTVFSNPLKTRVS